MGMTKAMVKTSKKDAEKHGEVTKSYWSLDTPEINNITRVTTVLVNTLYVEILTRMT